MKYNKLVRDKILSIIKSKGIQTKHHIAEKIEYEKKLKEKLSEEVDEFLAKPSKEELVDILEVVYTLGSLLGANRKQLENLRERKAKERGSFKKRIILEETK